MSEREKREENGKKPGDGGDPEKWGPRRNERWRWRGGKKGIEWREGKGKGKGREGGKGNEGKRSERARVGTVVGIDGWRVDGMRFFLPFQSFQPGARSLSLSLSVFWVGENCCGLTLLYW